MDVRARTRRRAAAALATACLLLGVVAWPAQAQEKTAETGVGAFLQKTMAGLRFEEVLDLAPPGSAQARTLAGVVDKEARTTADYAKLLAKAEDAKPIVQQPQLDVTVLELDRLGRLLSSGTVLMSPQNPQGVVVPVDQNFRTDKVRYRQWDDAGWYTGKGQGSIDIVPGRENAPIDFMLPYPASVLKLMVNFGVLRLVDKGEIKLDDTYAYEPTAISSLCGPASSNTIRAYMDASITSSSNPATCALVKLLHDRKAVDGLNQTFQDLGLETMQLKNTNPDNGGRWSNPVTMSSLDTAKLLALVEGVPGTAWTAPNGKPVTSGGVLSATSRALFKKMLGEQGYNDMLSTANRCAAGYPAAGIPQRVDSRWVAADGTVTVAGNAFGQDVRPCNQRAQVTFSHKTGWVNNSGADAGIVKSLPGKNGRRYIVAAFTNLGTQYVDAARPAAEPGVWPVSYTEKLAKLGAAIDTYETARFARPAR
ncbi:serine hydrolase [Nonomuraea purpurea]|uniref:Serine hydrolase n=1 Tax=Nonomuraea purpurea TaxID=1849276 RepID=A0ABV8GBP6_9ACTN